jgi:hypothetical protein
MTVALLAVKCKLIEAEAEAAAAVPQAAGVN